MKLIGLYEGELANLRKDAHLFEQDAADLCGVSLSTYRKWERSNKAPKSVTELFKARAGCIWPGWSYRDGYLYDPQGREFHEGTFMAAFYTLQAAESLNVELVHAKAGNLKHENNKKLKRAPVPCSISVLESYQISLFN